MSSKPSCPSAPVIMTLFTETPRQSRSERFSYFFPGDAVEILAIIIFGERLRQLEQSGFVDETHAPGDFLDTGDFEALPVFDDFDELRSVEQ